jgi:predicted transposase/invertase (TIGR01784 family)
MTWQQTIDEEKDIAFEEGKSEGLAEGVKLGIEQGIEQGIERAKIEYAKAMLADGVDINLIVKYTGLPLEKITEELS